MTLTKASIKRDWVLTQEAFDRFLGMLDRDRDKAGEKYEYIRLKLLKYFQWCGSDMPDIYADETINRVTRRIDEGQHIYNLKGYIYGVAKLVHTESLKLRHQHQGLDEGSLVQLPSMAFDSAAVQYQDCLERCLRHLSEEEREVLIEYYRHDKTEKITCRKRLAAKLGISLNTLRVKMHRQRSNLERCVEKCFGRHDATNDFNPDEY